MLRKAYIHYGSVVMVLLPALKEGFPHPGGNNVGAVRLSRRTFPCGALGLSCRDGIQRLAARVPVRQPLATRRILSHDSWSTPK
jgi:hypothetical protein